MNTSMECRWRIIGVLITVLFLAVAIGYMGKVEEANAEEPKPIVFGAALAITGSLADGGSFMRRGYDLWVDNANARGGINVAGVKRKVEIKYYDDRSDATTCAKLVQKLIAEDKIELILGPFASGIAFGASTISEKYRVPMISGLGVSDDIYNRGYKYVFTPALVASRYLEPLFYFCQTLKPKPKTVAILSKNELFSLTAAEGGKKFAEKLGFKVVYFEKYPPASADLSSPITAIKRLNPDVVIVTGHSADTVLATKQSKELNLTVPILLMCFGPGFTEYDRPLGKNANFVMGNTMWHPNFPYKDEYFGTAANYAKEHMKKYGLTPGYGEALATVSALIFEKGIEKAGSTEPQKVRDAIAKLDTMTFFGPIKFDERGVNVSPLGGVMQVKDGKPMLIYPKEVQETEAVYPFPGWGGSH